MRKSLLLVLAVLVAAPVWAGSNERVRPGGSAADYLVPLINVYTDTFTVDTFYSDTITVNEALNWFFYDVNRGAVTLADSANDSVLITINVYSLSESGYKKKIGIKSGMGANDADNVTDTASGRFYIAGYPLSPDSVVLNKVFFETIVSDSFKLGAACAYDYDTTYIPIQIHVYQR